MDAPLVALPSKAASALRTSIHEWAGAEVAFEIVSVQKASDDSSGPTIPTGLPSDSGPVGACPPAGVSETWCVVISPAIVDQEGNAISHILVQSQGRYWDAQKLLDTDRAVFEVSELHKLGNALALKNETRARVHRSTARSKPAVTVKYNLIANIPE